MLDESDAFITMEYTVKALFSASLSPCCCDYLYLVPTSHPVVRTEHARNCLTE